MSFLKRLFGLKKKEEPISPEVNISQDSVPEDSVQSNTHKKEFLHDNCYICNGVIGYEKRKRIAGKLWHKKCFREQYKKMKAQGKAI